MRGGGNAGVAVSHFKSARCGLLIRCPKLYKKAVLYTLDHHRTDHLCRSCFPAVTMQAAIRRIAHAEGPCDRKTPLLRNVRCRRSRRLASIVNFALVSLPRSSASLDRSVGYYRAVVASSLYVRVIAYLDCFGGWPCPFESFGRRDRSFCPTLLVADFFSRRSP